METKRCSKCKEVKDLCEFNKNKSKKDGLSTECKSCVTRYNHNICFDTVTLGTKVCSKCGKEKSVSGFCKNKKSKDGLCSWCRSCLASYDASRNYKSRTTGFKQCSKCGEDKFVNEFSRDKSRKDGLCTQCKLCVSVRMVTYNLTERGVILRRVKYNNRRAKKKGNGGTHTAEDVKRQGDMQKWMCWWCGPGCAGYCKDKYEVDHIVPIDKGGHNDPSNLVISCQHCNRSKKDKLPEEWIGRLF